VQNIFRYSHITEQSTYRRAWVQTCSHTGALRNLESLDHHGNHRPRLIITYWFDCYPGSISYHWVSLVVTVSPTRRLVSMARPREKTVKVLYTMKFCLRPDYTNEKLVAQEIENITMFLSSFFINVLANHECWLIGYATHYLFSVIDREGSSVPLLTKFRPLLGVFEVSAKRI